MSDTFWNETAAHLLNDLSEDGHSFVAQASQEDIVKKGRSMVCRV